LAISNNTDHEYTPSDEKFSNTNLSRFMKKHKITSYQRLVQQSNKNIEWYWNAVNKDLDLKWFRKYDRLIDSSNGISDTKWFIGGKCNIVANAIDRQVKSQPDKIAYF